MSLKGTTQSFSILRGEGDEAELEAYDLELDEAWWCWTAFTESNTNRNLTWPSVGIARQESVAHVPLKSTVAHA